MGQFIVVLLLVAHLKSLAADNPLRMLPINLECEADPDVVTNISCSMFPLEEGGASVSLAGTFLKEVCKMWVFHGTYQKMGRKKFKPNFVKATIDVCDFTNAMKGTFMNRFADMVTADVQKYIHPCPYSGSMEMHNLSFTGSMYLKLLRPASYRFDYRLYNEVNQTVFYLKYYVAIGTKA